MLPVNLRRSLLSTGIHAEKFLLSTRRRPPFKALPKLAIPPPLPPMTYVRTNDATRLRHVAYPQARRLHDRMTIYANIFGQKAALFRAFDITR